MLDEEAQPGDGRPPLPDDLAPVGRPGPADRLRGAVIAGLIVGAAVLAGLALGPRLDAGDMAMVLLVAVLLGAVRFGLSTGVAAALLSFLALNFFFIQPTFTFSVADPHQVVTLLAFLAAAVLTGSLAGRLREAARSARLRALTLEALYGFSTRLTGRRDLRGHLTATVQQIAETLRCPAVACAAGDDAPAVLAASPQGLVLGPHDADSARLALRSGRTVPRPAAGWPGARFEFRPVLADGRVVAVIGTAEPDRRWLPAGELDGALAAILRQSGLAIERSLLASQAADARTQAEQEHLRAALLSSVSHDLRTPLAAILGAVTSLRRFGTSLPAEARAELLGTIEEEADRLSRFVTNLLHMTRLEASAIDARPDWIDCGDACRAAIARLKRAYPGRSVVLSAAAVAPPVRGDASLLEQAVFNILDNAAKHSDGSGAIQVSVVPAGGAMLIAVTDEGPGIPAGDLERVFEKFYRSPAGGGGTAGAGLGLTIARGIVTAMGGTLVAASPVARGRGACLTIRLPVGDGAAAGPGSIAP